VSRSPSPTKGCRVSRDYKDHLRDDEPKLASKMSGCRAKPLRPRKNGGAENLVAAGGIVLADLDKLPGRSASPGDTATFKIFSVTVWNFYPMTAGRFVGRGGPNAFERPKIKMRVSA
jgi:hypothetical protein